MKNLSHDFGIQDSGWGRFLFDAERHECEVEASEGEESPECAAERFVQQFERDAARASAMLDALTRRSDRVEDAASPLFGNLLDMLGAGLDAAGRLEKEHGPKMRELGKRLEEIGNRRE